jgi:hypothetical protein
MKKILLVIILFPFLIECSKHNDAVFDENDPSVLFKNTITNGFYMGHFDFQSQSYWC